MQAWKCATCRQSVKASFQYCPGCGGHWSKVADAYEASAPWPRQGGAWWRGNSPRGRAHGAHGQWPSPARRRGKGNQGKASEGKPKSGKGPPATEDGRALPPPPAPQPVATPRDVAGATSMGPASGEAQTLQAILGALGRVRDELPPSVKELIDAHATEDTRAEGKNLHRLVSVQTTSKKELLQIQAARRDYMRQWSQFITRLCDSWTDHLKEKDKVLQSFEEKEQQWEKQLAEATAALAKLTVGRAPTHLKEKDKVLQSFEEKEQQWEKQLAEATAALAKLTVGRAPTDAISIGSDDIEEQEEAVNDAIQQEVAQQQFRQATKEREDQITVTLEAAKQAAQAEAALVQTDRERSPRRKSQRGEAGTDGKSGKESQPSLVGGAKATAVQPPPQGAPRVA
eukprot:s758_g11.t1